MDDMTLVYLAFLPDPTYVSNFMLTYRRFATPRSVLLTMQKKMRLLDQETADPMFACLAQMKYTFSNLTTVKFFTPVQYLSSASGVDQGLPPRFCGPWDRRRIISARQVHHREDVPHPLRARVPSLLRNAAEPC